MAHERERADEPKSSTSSSRRHRPKTDTDQYEHLHRLLNPRSGNSAGVPRAITKIWDDQDKTAKRVLKWGLPDTPEGAALRPKLWKLMLGVEELPVREYLMYVSRGPSAVSSKSESGSGLEEEGHEEAGNSKSTGASSSRAVKNDTFRTLATDKQFKGKVNEEMLIRLLEAFVWKNEDQERDGLPFTYVQGMNVLAAPFLYAMPTQIEAFACFSTFIERCCPLYVQPTLVGVHNALKLVDRCLEKVNKELFDYLRSKNLSAEIYAFPCELLPLHSTRRPRGSLRPAILTLCACTPPLNEVLQLWDFLLAFGVHLNILCVVAQLQSMESELKAHPSPMKMLRNFPPLVARDIIEVTNLIAVDLDEELYDEIIRHPYQR